LSVGRSLAAAERRSDASSIRRSSTNVLWRNARQSPDTTRPMAKMAWSRPRSAEARQRPGLAAGESLVEIHRSVERNQEAVGTH
jgi:hypothetical protein